MLRFVVSDSINDLLSSLTSVSQPFGPLNALHTHVLTHATPLTLTNWPWYFIVPLVPLYPQAYLLTFKDTRLYRSALGVVGLGLLLMSWASYRFEQTYFQALNDGATIALFHLAFKYIEFSFLDETIIDPYLSCGSRSRWMSAFDLCINSRMVGLGSVGLDRIKSISTPAPSTTSSPRPMVSEIKNGIPDSNSLVPPPISTPLSVPQTATTTCKPELIVQQQQRFLPPFPSIKRTRYAATIRHIRHALIHYVTVDTLLNLLHVVGPETIGKPGGIPNALHTFVTTTRFTLFPGSGIAWDVPPLVVALISEACVPMVIWQSMSAGYHVFAMFAVGSGMYEVASWEIDLYDAPWKADSILDLWGRRWHQLFRHQFVVMSTATLSVLRLPSTSVLILPLIFLFSGLLHATGELSMTPVPCPLTLILFFLLSGVGAALEVAFKKVTGKRVGGWCGRIWTWVYMFAIGRMATDSWLDAGVGSNYLLPDHGPGEYVAGWLLSAMEIRSV